jgi:hypothetical protein
MSQATVKYSWTDSDGSTYNPAPHNITCPCTVGISGAIPVPAGTPSGTEFDVPFTGIASAATMVFIENKTGQELGAAWGGNFAPNLAPGGILFYAHPAPVGAGKVTSLRFFLTQTQAADGQILYAACGS